MFYSEIGGGLIFGVFHWNIPFRDTSLINKQELNLREELKRCLEDQT